MNELDQLVQEAAEELQYGLQAQKTGGGSPDLLALGVALLALVAAKYAGVQLQPAGEQHQQQPGQPDQGAAAGGRPVRPGTLQPQRRVEPAQPERGRRR